MIRSVRGEKFFVPSNLAPEALNLQIGDFSGQSGIGAFCQIGGILIPTNSRLEIFLLLI